MVKIVYNLTIIHNPHLMVITSKKNIIKKYIPKKIITIIQGFSNRIKGIDPINQKIFHSISKFLICKKNLYLNQIQLKRISLLNIVNLPKLTLNYNFDLLDKEFHHKIRNKLIKGLWNYYLTKIKQLIEYRQLTPPSIHTINIFLLKNSSKIRRKK